MTDRKAGTSAPYTESMGREFRGVRDAQARPASTAAFLDGADREPPRLASCPGELLFFSILVLGEGASLRSRRAAESSGVEQVDWDENDRTKSSEPGGTD